MALLYDLTPYTGRDAVGDRTVVIQGREIRWRVVIWLAFGMVPSIIVVGMLIPLFGSKSLFAIPVVEVSLLVLFVYRTNGGLRLTPARTLGDLYRASEGVVHLCDTVLDLRPADVLILRQSTVPVSEFVNDPRPAANEVGGEDSLPLSLFGGGTAGQATVGETALRPPDPDWKPVERAETLASGLGEPSPAIPVPGEGRPSSGEAGIPTPSAPEVRVGGPKRTVDQATASGRAPVDSFLQEALR